MHTATGFQLILNTVRALMFLVLTYLPWINAQNFSAFSFHRLHQSQNSDFHIIKMTLEGCGEGRERERQRETERDREEHTQRQRKTERQRETQREAQRQRWSSFACSYIFWRGGVVVHELCTENEYLKCMYLTLKSRV